MLDNRACCRCNKVSRCMEFHISECFTNEPPYVCKSCLEKMLKEFQMLEDVEAFI